MSVLVPNTSGLVVNMFGNMIDPFNLTEKDLNITLFARSLSRICRFWNQTSEFYSVAQHCLVMSELFEDRELQKWALMHEIYEAYLGDIPSPIKHLPELKFYREAETAFLEMAASYYGLTPPMPKEIKIADKRLMVTEAIKFMPQDCYDWTQHGEPYPKNTIRHIMTAKEAETAFVLKWYVLFE